MNDSNLHEEIFKGTTFSSLLKNIYESSTTKTKQINILINELKPLITDASQAILLVPLIKEYIDVGVRNDELLVKMAMVYQRYLAAESRDVLKQNGAELTDEEKKQLLNEIGKEVLDELDDAKSDMKKIEVDFDELNSKVKSVKKEIINE